MRILVLCLTCVLILSALCQGAPLTIPTSDLPDLTMLFGTASYTAGTGTFLLSSSFLGFIDVAGTAHLVENGSLNLTAAIDSSGTPSGGTLEASGAIPTAGIPDMSLLLRAALIAIGFEDPGATSNLIEFQFEVTEGALANQFQGTAVVLLSDSGFDPSGGFDVDFGSFLAVADVQSAVPEPATAALAGAALVAAVLVRRMVRA